MRGGKEEKSSSSPMFPRLHVNDADKGGPRAPPRNKMALYEQLSIPLQRFDSSSLPLPPQSNQILGSQGGGHEGNAFSTFKVSPSVHSYSAEKVKSRSSNGKTTRALKGEFERRYSRHAEKNLPRPKAGEKPAESSRFVKSTSDREHDRSRGTCQESCGDGALEGPISRSESPSKASRGHSSKNVDDICNRTSDDKDNRSLGQNDAGKNDELSDTSTVDSVSGLEISPDDVVGVIGPKQFWNARRAIVNQQQIFTEQVFELHRLIKVQKLLAASPHLLLEDKFCVTSQKLPIKNLPIEPYCKPQSQNVKQKDDSQKPNQNTDYQMDSTGVAPRPAHNDVLNKAADQSTRCNEPYSGNMHPVPPASENRLNPWCFQPPAHQWLVPVMSPSEGLVYKPYVGRCPPAAGFMAPVYGNYSPVSPHPGYVVSPHPQQNMGVLSGASPIVPNYLPTPYGLPAMNPIISSSTVEQMSPMAGPRPNLQTEQNSRSSCNMSFPKSDAFAGRPWKVHASKDSELQGSTASSPCEKAARGEGRDALPLFPMAPTAVAFAQPSESDCKAQQTRVIRVVPHNARSATESAARIFRSIQEARQQLDQ